MDIHSMRQSIVCPLCGTDFQADPFIPKRTVADVDVSRAFDCTSPGHHHHNDVFRCPSCDNGFLFPLPSEKELIQAYADVTDTTYLKEQEARYKTFRYALTVLKRFRASGKLLEIGSYCGLFLDLAQQQGFEPTGIEPSEWANHYVQTHFGFPTLQGPFIPSFVETQLEAETFEAIASWDVLEHVHHPQEFLDQVQRLLVPGGIFAFSTLNIDNWWVKFMGKRWPWYMQMHLYYFTIPSLRTLLWKNGMEMIHYEPYHHIISLNYFIHKLETLLNLRIPLPKFLRPFLNSIYIPFYFGDIMLVVARKRSLKRGL